MTRPNRPPSPVRAPEAPARAHPTQRTAPSAPSETYLGRPWSPPPRPAPAADALPRSVQMSRFPQEATTMSSPSRSPDPKLARGPEVASPAAREAPSPPVLPRVEPASPTKHLRIPVARAGSAGPRPGVPGLARPLGRPPLPPPPRRRPRNLRFGRTAHGPTAPARASGRRLLVPGRAAPPRAAVGRARSPGRFIMASARPGPGPASPHPFR